MELRNDFRLGMALETAWLLLTDVERVAPCLPGAQLQEIADGEYRGLVKVKVGPITAQYKGKAVFAEQDGSAGRLVIKASGRENGGRGGNANATVTATLVADGETTLVSVVSDLAITGKLAHFGQGVLSKVSANLLRQFAECVEKKARTARSEPEPARAGGESTTVRRIDGPEVEPVDLYHAAGNSITKRAVPILASLVVGILVVLWWRRRSRP